MTADVSKETAATFLRAMFGERPDGRLTVVRFKDDGGAHTSWPATSSQAAGKAAEWAPKWDTYFGCGLRRERLPGARRGGSADVGSVTAIWAELDFGTAGHNSDKLPPTEADAQRLLEEFGLPASAVVRSGGGLHVYWFLTGPVPSADGEPILRIVGAALAAIGARYGWHVDTVSDPARVLRVPGTFNHKTGEPRPVQLLELDSDRRYDLAAVDAAARAALAAYATYKPVPEVSEASQDGARPGERRTEADAPNGKANPAAEAYAARALALESAELARVRSTGRNNALNAAAMALATLASAYDAAGLTCYTDGEVWGRLWAACHDNELAADDGERRCRATFESGWRSGWASPRQLPDLRAGYVRERVDAGSQAPAVDDAGGGGGGVSGVSTVMGVSGVSVHRQTLSARDLMALEIPPARYVVRPILPEGLALLAGKGKIGKSFLALQLACACASGGQFLGVRVDRCDVLYLALEDGKRRLRDRMRGMLQGDTIPAGLHFDTSDSGDYWRQPDGLERIEAWCDEHPDAGLVIIDVLAKVRPRRVSNRAAYDEDYAAVEGLQQLATERRICILVLTHVRKMVAEDWVDCVTGTTGVTGAVDTILGMMRERGAADAALKGTGRDLDDFAWALSRDGMTGGWTLEGNAADVALSKARREILDALGEMGTGTPRGVANHLGRDDKGYQSLRQLMPKMAREGLLLGDGEAGYKLSGRLPISDHTTHTDHTDNGAAGSVSDDPLQWNETP